MMSDKAVILKHYRLLSKNIGSLSDGQAVLKQEDDDDSLTTVRVTLTPRSGPYRGGVFDFEIDLGEGYPTCPPATRALTPIYHPNVDCYSDDDEDVCGDVCLNLLDELWSSDMTLEDVVQGLLFLLHEPNLEDPLSSLFCGHEEEEEFRRNVRRSLRGGITIDGVRFQRNLAEGYESECEEDDEEEEEGDAPGDQDNIANSASVESKGAQIEVPALSSDSNDCNAGDGIDTDSSPHNQMTTIHREADKETASPSPCLLPAPSPPSHVLESPVDREDQASLPFSQRDVSLNGFDKMWTLSLNSIVRTIVLGAHRTNQRSVDTSDIGVQ